MTCEEKKDRDLHAELFYMAEGLLTAYDGGCSKYMIEAYMGGLRELRQEIKERDRLTAGRAVDDGCNNSDS